MPGSHKVHLGAELVADFDETAVLSGRHTLSEKAAYGRNRRNAYSGGFLHM